LIDLNLINGRVWWSEAGERFDEEIRFSLPYVNGADEKLKSGELSIY
jgi:hypothetical protein